MGSGWYHHADIPDNLVMRSVVSEWIRRLTGNLIRLHITIKKDDTDSDDQSTNIV
jgi:hypothetical protein